MRGSSAYKAVLGVLPSPGPVLKLCSEQLHIDNENRRHVGDCSHRLRERWVKWLRVRKDEYLPTSDYSGIRTFN